MNRIGISFAVLTLTVAACAQADLPQPALSPAEARAIAKEAYIYGYPMVDSYRIQYAYFVNRNSPEFRGAWNEIHNLARVFTPEDRAIQTPNSDTPYSMAALDLRAEPVVLTLPAIAKDRYFSVQLIDLYTHNFTYLGSRTTGNDGGSVLIAGPGWQGAPPAGIAQVIRCETELLLATYRTQLFNPGDLANVKAIQAGYRVQTLSAFLGQAAPPPAAAINFVTPLTPDAQKTALAFFDILNFVLRFCPTHPSETALMARFARLNIGAGMTFGAAALPAELRDAVAAGMADAWQTFAAFKQTQVDTGKVTSGDLFGTRDALANNYLYRMGGAIIGIYGNSKQEAMYPIYTTDDAGQPLNGAHRYTLRFQTGRLPPVKAFWSLTMYELPASLLVANPMNRYLINSPMLPALTRDPDGGLTLYIQHESPGQEREANWLPAPAGPFMAVMRLYWPESETLNGQWKQPPLQVVR